MLYVSFFSFPALLGAKPQVRVIEPTLGEVFPLLKKDQSVILSHDVIINNHTIAKAGAKFRVIFQMPDPEDKDVRAREQRKKMDLRQNFSRKTSYIEKESAYETMTPLQQATIDRAYETTWSDPLMFLAALHKLPIDKIRLVFTNPETNQVRVEPIDLRDGMFLGLTDKGVKIMAIEQESRAARGGASVNKIITKINEIDIERDLKAFLNVYKEEREKCQRSGKPLELTLKNMEKENITREVISFTLPRSMGINDFFSDIEGLKQP